MTAPIKLAWLIDDDEVDQRLYKRIIDRTGLIDEFVTFTFADEALDHLKANPGLNVDLILLDINMPRMSGLEFLAAATTELGGDFAKVVVAMLTTSMNPADRHAAENFAVVKDFIHKPLTAEHLQDLAKHFQE